jgi:hypothetical protein
MSGHSPAAAAATRRLNKAAPHAIRAARPCGSADESILAGSAASSITLLEGQIRNRQGWALCSDGAATAARNNSSISCRDGPGGSPAGAPLRPSSAQRKRLPVPQIGVLDPGADGLAALLTTKGTQGGLR